MPAHVNAGSGRRYVSAHLYLLVARARSVWNCFDLFESKAVDEQKQIECLQVLFVDSRNESFSPSVAGHLLRFEARHQIRNRTYTCSQTTTRCEQSWKSLPMTLHKQMH